MSYHLRVLFFSLLISNAYAVDIEVEAKINTLNEASIKSLGVSLNALTYLVQASGNSYIPLWHLEKSGDIAFINELENAKYIKVNKRQGLPDGHEPEETFINIVPLYKGNEVIRCMLALKHNQALKAQPSAAGDAASGAP